MIYSVDPQRKYTNVINGAVDVCEIKSAFAIQGVAANVQLVAAVTGKKIRVMKVTISSTTTATNGGVSLLDGSGGTIKWAFTAPDPAVNSPFTDDFGDSGLFELTTATGLFLTVQTASANVFVEYIEFTPA